MELRTKSTPSIVLSVDEFTESAVYSFLREILLVAKNHSTRYYVEIQSVYGESHRGLLIELEYFSDSRCVFFCEPNLPEVHEERVSLNQVKSISLYEVI